MRLEGLDCVSVKRLTSKIELTVVTTTCFRAAPAAAAASPA